MYCLDLRIKIKKDGKFWNISCLDYPVFTQGLSKKEAIENLKEAFLLYAEDAEVQAEHPELKPYFAPKMAEANVQAVTTPIAPLSSLLPRVYDPLTRFVRQGTRENPL